MEFPLNKSILSFVILFAVLFALGGVWIIYQNPPEMCRWYPQCSFHAVTGVLCPGCGATRAVYHLLHGEFFRSLQCNLLIYICVCNIPLIVLNPKRFALIVGVFLLILAIVFTILRNLDCWISPLLRP